MASDLRITGFDARERASDEQQGSIFDIVMAYSDSTVKVWSYSQNKWTLEKSGNYLTACLTDVRYLSAKQDEPSDNYRLVTTATDGHIAMWHCSEIDMLAWLHRRRVHQNAILNATDDILSDGSPLLVTAGDDNGVGLSRIDAKNGVSTLLIPRAHAAAVTALAMYKYDDDCFYVLSASIDQRVKLWDICIDTTVAGVASLQVRKVQNVFTSVADVSSMALLRLEDDSTGCWYVVLAWTSGDSKIHLLLPVARSPQPSNLYFGGAIVPLHSPNPITALPSLSSHQPSRIISSPSSR
jgi:WD40 repeat protein